MYQDADDSVENTTVDSLASGYGGAATKGRVSAADARFPNEVTVGFSNSDSLPMSAAAMALERQTGNTATGGGSINTNDVSSLSDLQTVGEPTGLRSPAMDPVERVERYLTARDKSRHRIDPMKEEEESRANSSLAGSNVSMLNLRRPARFRTMLVDVLCCRKERL